MSYPYYNTNPGWGTENFRFGAPPVPGFQPSSSWGGRDFYRAHASNPDPDLYDHAWNRVRDYSGSTTLGVGMNEARYWHRRAYGGLGDLTQMSPSDLGHAAAYEAYRSWIHNNSIYEPLGEDLERQREGLIGLAVAEATKLLQYAGRTMDSLYRMEASEAAAATASHIFSQSRTMDDDYLPGRYSGYAASSPQFSSSASAFDPYAYDDLAEPFFGRGRSRSRRRSFYGGYGSSDMYGRPGAIAVPTTYGSYGGYPGSYGSYAGYPGSYGGSYGTYPTYGYPGAVPVAPASSIIIETKPRRRHRSHRRSRSRSVAPLVVGSAPNALTWY